MKILVNKPKSFTRVETMSAWATNIAATSIPCQHSGNSLIFHLFYNILTYDRMQDFIYNC